MNKNWTAALGAALIVAFAAPVVQADTLSGVERARTKARAGYHLNSQDRDYLRRYGGNDSYGWRSGYRDYDYDYGYYGGPGISVYVGPGGYYGPYDY